MMGMKISHLSAIESRRHHFDEHDLAELANAYDLHPATFFNLNPNDPAHRKHLELAIAAGNDADEED